MTTMTLRMNDADAELVRRYAEFEGKNISNFIRDAVLEKIEDAHDIEALHQALATDDGVRITHEELMRELEL